MPSGSDGNKSAGQWQDVPPACVFASTSNLHTNSWFGLRTFWMRMARRGGNTNDGLMERGRNSVSENRRGPIGSQVTTFPLSFEKNRTCKPHSKTQSLDRGMHGSVLARDVFDSKNDRFTVSYVTCWMCQIDEDEASHCCWQASCVCLGW